MRQSLAVVGEGDRDIEAPKLQPITATPSVDADLFPTLVDGRPPEASTGAGQAFAMYHVLASRLADNTAAQQVIAVSSARPDAGKSTCAANLAAALANVVSTDGLGRVLLLEANPQRASLARKLGVDGGPCVRKQLAEYDKCSDNDKSTFTWKVLRLKERLDALLVADDRANMMQLGNTLQLALKRFRLAYQHIVIDTTSVLQSAHVNQLLPQCDVVLLAARRGATRTTDIKQAARQLGDRANAAAQHADSRIAGVVLIG